MKNRKVSKKVNLHGDGFFDDLKTAGKMLYDDVGSAFKTIKHTVPDVVQKVLYGREDYPPHVREILDIWGNQKVHRISLHRLVLPSLYTEIMHKWTSQETRNRLNNEPKDKLFHISMWVKLDNETILCEKNEALRFKVKPKKANEEEVYDLPSVPSNLTFIDLIENGRKLVGNKIFFSYSAKDNNCGNWIEYILKANGLNTQGTHDFIGQDTKKILEGFPTLRKTLNTLTDIAGRAGVVMEGGKIKKIKNKGDNGLTDQEIMEILKHQQIQCHGCFTVDELKTLKNGNYIINLNGQSHWCALIKKGKKYIWFDSYGFKPPEEVEDLIPAPYYYNKHEIQGLQQTSCGFYCITLLKYLKYNHNDPFEFNFEHFLEFFGNNKSQNQKLIKQMLES